MKKLKVITIMIVAGMFMLQACEEDAPGPNGNGHLHGTVVEHSDDTGGVDDHGGLSGASVYIWYGQTTEDGDPDDMTTTNASGTFDFENMSKGDYFLRAEYIEDHDGNEVHLEGHATVTIEKKAEEVEVEIEVSADDNHIPLILPG